MGGVVVQIPYGIQSYKRADIPRIRLENLFVEKTPAEPGGLVLLPRPALAAYDELGSGPIRGMFQQPGAIEDSLFTVSGNALYNGALSIGTIAGTGRVSMAATLNALLVATGDALYATDGATVTSIAFPDDAGVTAVGFIGGYAIASRADSRRIYYTLDPFTWDGLDYLSAEQSTGDIVGMAIISDQVWVFCEQVTEIFVTTGDPDAPLQRVEGRLLDKGTLARDSIAKLDNTVFWIGHDSIVYRGDSTPLRVSDHGIEERIAASDLADLNAWAFPWFGHTFYVLNTTDGTFSYDAATQQWHALSSLNRPKWRALLGVLFNRYVIAGDDETGQLWRLDNDLMTDDGTEIQRWFTVLIKQAGFIDNIALSCSVGDTGSPTTGAGLIEMRTSRDGGQTFTEFRGVSLGEEGHYRQRVAFRRLGVVDQDNMTIQFRVTDPRPSRISYVRVNEPLGGRSR
jgi:hypothetical protein